MLFINNRDDSKEVSKPFVSVVQYTYMHNIYNIMHTPIHICTHTHTYRLLNLPLLHFWQGCKLYVCMCACLCACVCISVLCKIFENTFLCKPQLKYKVQLFECSKNKVVYYQLSVKHHRYILGNYWIIPTTRLDR